MFPQIVLLVLLLWPVLSAAQYDIRLVDVPFAGTRDTVLTGHNSQGERLGVYQDAYNKSQGFLATCTGEVFSLLNVTPRAFNVTSDVVGTYFLPGSGTRGFLVQDGSFLGLLGPPTPRTTTTFPTFPTLVEAFDVSDAPLVIVGAYHYADGVTHGFRYTVADRLYTTIDVPGAAHTEARRIAEDGRILVKATAPDGSVSYFLWHAGTFTPLPSLPCPN